MTRRKIATILAKFYLRQARGSGLLAFLEDTFKRMVYVGAAWYLVKAWIGVDLSKNLLIFLAISYIVVTYFVGYIDERIGFWKFQNDYQAKELTPFFRELDKKVNEIQSQKGIFIEPISTKERWAQAEKPEDLLS